MLYLVLVMKNRHDINHDTMKCHMVHNENNALNADSTKASKLSRTEGGKYQMDMVQSSACTVTYIKKVDLIC